LQAQGAAHAQGTCGIGGEAEGPGHWNHPTALHSLKHNVKDGTKLICLTSVCSLVRKTEAEGQRSYLFSSFLLYYRRYNCWNNQMLEICCSPFGDWKKKKKKKNSKGWNEDCRGIYIFYRNLVSIFSMTELLCLCSQKGILVLVFWYNNTSL
jgi:hypothetical protein